jgi:AraC-like DNA-binding protein
MSRRTPPRSDTAFEATLDEQALDVLLQLKAETLTEMSGATEHAWPLLMGRYVIHCRSTRLHPVAVYTLLIDFTYQARALAAHRTFSVTLPTPLSASCVRGGRDQICDWFQEHVIEVFRTVAFWDGPPWELPRIATYLEQACAVRLRTTELATRTGWKPLPLARAFKSHTGMTIHEYLTRARVRRATELLAAGEKIEWVMLHVGYHNRTHFNNEFRRHVGCVPSDFKRQRLGAADSRPAERNAQDGIVQNGNAQNGCGQG